MKLLLLMALISGAAVAQDLAEFEACISGIEQHAQKLRRWLPAEVLSTDRRLYYMTLAVPVLRENQATAVRTGSATLLANSVEGCQQFRRQYAARTWLFLAFLACVSSLVAALTARAILTIFSTPSFPGVGKRALVSSANQTNPTDRDRGDS